MEENLEHLRMPASKGEYELHAIEILDWEVGVLMILHFIMFLTHSEKYNSAEARQHVTENFACRRRVPSATKILIDALPLRMILLPFSERVETIIFQVIAVMH